MFVCDIELWNRKVFLWPDVTGVFIIIIFTTLQGVLSDRSHEENEILQDDSME